MKATDSYRGTASRWRMAMRFLIDALGSAAIISTFSLVHVSPAHADVIYGTSASDSINGTPDQDTIWAYGGWDYVDAKDANDVIHSGSGRDASHGAGGRDTVYGGADGDDLWGGNGDDELVDSESEADWDGDNLYGNADDDYINMEDGDGNDRGYGGPGIDSRDKDPGDYWDGAG
jgi:Ca2+-binding RTX toxin-like protein